MMNCQEVRERILLNWKFLSKEAFAHIGSCPSCKEFYEDEVKLRGIFETWKVSLKKEPPKLSLSRVLLSSVSVGLLILLVFLRIFSPFKKLPLFRAEEILIGERTAEVVALELLPEEVLYSEGGRWVTYWRQENLTIVEVKR
jgi:hypothetical protein